MLTSDIIATHAKSRSSFVADRRTRLLGITDDTTATTPPDVTNDPATTEQPNTIGLPDDEGYLLRMRSSHRLFVVVGRGSAHSDRDN